MLCKKADISKIYGVEIQEEVADMAKRSVELNNLQEKNLYIKNFHKNYSLFTPPKYMLQV